MLKFIFEKMGTARKNNSDIFATSFYFLYYFNKLSYKTLDFWSRNWVFKRNNEVMHKFKVQNLQNDKLFHIFPVIPLNIPNLDHANIFLNLYRGSNILVHMHIGFWIITLAILIGNHSNCYDKYLCSTLKSHKYVGKLLLSLEITVNWRIYVFHFAFI